MRLCGRARNLRHQFEIKGPTLLEIEEDTSVVVQGKTANVHDRGNTATASVPASFFVFSGYVPVTMEMMLVRYWLAHGRPASIPLLPTGEAFVELRGEDTVTISRKPAVLNRYQLSGKNWRGGWGRQTLWLDSENRLVAAVNLGSDIETNLYAFRDGYETATSFFLKRAIEDSIDRLTQVAGPAKPNHNEPNCFGRRHINQPNRKAASSGLRRRDRRRSYPQRRRTTDNEYPNER